MVRTFADDTTAVLSDLNSALALFKTLEAFEKVSGLKLNVRKTEAMWIGSLQNCEDEPLGVKWEKCVKFLGIFITYDVKQRVLKECSKEIAGSLCNLYNESFALGLLPEDWKQINTTPIH